MRTSRVDSKGRVLLPKEIRERMGIDKGTLLRWIPFSERVIGLVVEKKEGNDYESVLSFLENLTINEVERSGRPDYTPISKKDLWILSSKK